MPRIQTRRERKQLGDGQVVVVGSDYWNPLADWLQSKTFPVGFIDAVDLNRFLVVDSAEEAVKPKERNGTVAPVVVTGERANFLPRIHPQDDLSVSGAFDAFRRVRQRLKSWYANFTFAGQADPIAAAIDLADRELDVLYVVQGELAKAGKDFIVF